MTQKMLRTVMAGAIAVTAGVSGMAFATDDATAKTYTSTRFVNKDKCFKAKRIPQTIEVNTRGQFVSGASKSWKGNPQKSGSKVTLKHNDPVFIQTTRVLEDQHVTLVPVKC